jgi:hypothetical protein
VILLSARAEMSEVEGTAVETPASASARVMKASMLMSKVGLLLDVDFEGMWGPTNVECHIPHLSVFIQEKSPQWWSQPRSPRG